MLDLDSKRWAELVAGSANPRLVPELIQSLMDRPTEQDWAEVWEQCAHQWTLSLSAYAAFPHLLRLGIMQGISTQPDFLIDLSRIAAPLEWSGPCPDDLKPGFDAALREAAQVALQAAKNPVYEPHNYVCALQAAAATHGRQGPGTQLFFTLACSSPEAELDCPQCGGCLIGEFREPGLCLQSVDNRMRPGSKQVEVRPRAPSAVKWHDVEQPQEDFDWLVALCSEAKQAKVLSWICCLYGKADCPLCGRELTVMSEIERSHGI